MFLFLIGLACLFPLSLYCLYLAMLHQRAHPTMISGSWDMAGVLIALSGFLLAGGTTLIFAVHSAVRDYWLQVGPVHSLGGVYSRIGAWTFGLWGLYFLVLVVGGAYLIASRRECVVVYHIAPLEMDDILATVVERLGLPVERRGPRWIIGRAEHPIEFEKLLAGGPRPADKGVLDVEGTEAMRCVTLSWKYAGGNLRGDLEAELGRDLAAYPAPQSPATMWLMTASASLFALMIFMLGTFLIIALQHGGMARAPLPIDPILPQVVDALRRGNCAVLRAPTGAGKTTRVPPALLDAGLATKRIVMLEPRRLAARAAARRMAHERDGRVGDEIGYHVRFDKQWGAKTRIIAVTPGVLLRMMQDDPFLESADVVLFDEFHERGLESDLALGMVRHVQQNVRPELRVLVMSATLAIAEVSRYLGGCPIIESEGRSYPVQIVYEPKPDTLPWPAALGRAVERWLDRTDGDVLVFLPGLGEIRAAARELEPLAERHDLLIRPLHGELPAEQQDAALLPQPRRKIVLATNVAETSVTVDGVTLVIDTGLARLMNYDPAVGLDRLELQPISRASADQRAGRAGRTQPGICVRLWSELAHRAKAEQTEPEIRRVDLAGAVLQLLSLGEQDAEHFPWLEAPKPVAVAQARLLLSRLGATDEHGLTELGHTLARLPTHPRLARLLVEGRRLGCDEKAALAAALLSERDPFLRPPGGLPGGRETFSDIQDRIEALERFEHGGPATTPFGEVNRGAAQFLFRARDQLLRSASEIRVARPESSKGVVRAIATPFEDSGRATQEADWLQALLPAFPDRLAKRREAGSNRGVMVGGRGVRLAPACGVREPELFLCLDIDAGEGEAWVRQASGVRREWLPPEMVRITTEVEFDAAAERVIARKRTRFLDLLIDETPANLPADDTVAAVLADAATKDLSRVLPPDDSPAGNFLLRLRCLAEWMPALGLPKFDAPELSEAVRWLSAGCRSFDDLRRADWFGALHARLTHTQRQAIEREAPERIAVPSGSRIALKYEPGRPPVLAVRIQELFGLADTPRLAAGRVRVLLHLLAPNYRPQQVTDDLASFWANTYSQVRKELRARYPKHAWPDDPLSAPALRGPRKRH